MENSEEDLLARSMIHLYGAGAIERAYNHAHADALIHDEMGAARWRRVMLLIAKFLAPEDDADYPGDGLS